MNYDTERFWSKVDKSGDCWLWTAGKICGYGQYTLPGRISSRAHRVSWMMANGPISGNLLVCHKCDVKSCVRPDHLFLGTNKDNADDCVNKGRNTRGRKTTFAKLSERSVREIRASSGRGVLGIVLAKEYGVSPKAISKVIRRESWGHID